MSAVSVSMLMEKIAVYGKNGVSRSRLSSVAHIKYFCKINLFLLLCTIRQLGFVLNLMDPWGSGVKNAESVSEFEDNFKPSAKTEKLADSAEYLAVLERKLRAVRSKNKVVENLSAYRVDCINRLMRDGCDLDPVIGDTDTHRLLQEPETE